jgi:hypothetical protein
MQKLKSIVAKVARDKKQPDGTEHFFNQHYQWHNIKRLSHLDSLGLNIRSKSVLEIGAGVGDHTYYYLIKNCKVLSTDARENLVEYIKKRFGVPVMTLDVENDIEKLKQLERFDIIHCYGLLYHIQNPEGFINALKGKSEMVFLETCVSHDFREYGPHIVSEDTRNQTQSASGKGCRPTREWIFDILKKNFPFVYMPVTQPDHAEFPKNWEAPMEDRTKLIRAVFIVSEKEISNPNLTTSIPKIYQ